MWRAFFLVAALVAVASFGFAGIAAGGRRERFPFVAALVTAVAVAASTIALVAYAASEDDYRNNGMTRWEAYDAQTLTALAVAAGALAAIGLFVTWIRRDGRLAIASFATASGAGGAQFLAFFANSLN